MRRAVPDYVRSVVDLLVKLVPGTRRRQEGRRPLARTAQWFSRARSMIGRFRRKSRTLAWRLSKADAGKRRSRIHSERDWRDRARDWGEWRDLSTVDAMLLRPLPSPIPIESCSFRKTGFRRWIRHVPLPFAEKQSRADATSAVYSGLSP